MYVVISVMAIPELIKKIIKKAGVTRKWLWTKWNCGKLKKNTLTLQHTTIKTYAYLLVVQAGNYGWDVSFDAIPFDVNINKTKISLQVDLFSED